MIAWAAATVTPWVAVVKPCVDGVVDVCGRPTLSGVNGARLVSISWLDGLHRLQQADSSIFDGYLSLRGKPPNLYLQSFADVPA